MTSPSRQKPEMQYRAIRELIPASAMGGALPLPYAVWDRQNCHIKALCASKEDAEGLAHMLNCHDDLVAALKALLGREGGNPVHGVAGHIDFIDAEKMALAAIRAAEAGRMLTEA